MVQFIREQTRQYASDQSEAIETAQLAKNVGEWNDVIQGAGKVYSAFEKEFIEEPRKKAEQIDKDIIATQYGKTAHNATVGELDRLAERYGADSDIFKREAYALAERNYAPQIEGMTTEKYKTEMQANLRSTKDYIDVYQNTERAKAIEGNKAQQSADKLAKDFGNEAYMQGTRQEYSDLKGVDEYVKYTAKKTGLDQEDVKAAVEKDIATSRSLGVIDTDIVTAASALGDEEILRDYFTTVVNNDPKFANASDKKKNAAIQKLMDDETRKSTSNEHLRSIVGDAYMDALEKQYTKGLNEQKVAFQNELSKINPKSKAAEDLRKKIEEIKGQIDAVDDGKVLDIAREQLKQGNGADNPGLGGILKKRYAEFKQQMTVDSYNNSVRTWANAMDPDPLTAQRARFNIWASENGLINKQSTEIGEWEGKNMSKYNPLMSPISNEVNVEQLASDYQKYIKNSETVSSRLHEEYQGTMAMHDALQDLWNTPNLTPIQAVALGYKAINKMYEAPLTEEQRQTFNNLVVRAIQDRGFGDMARAVLENGDRYYPDTNWMENAFGGKDLSVFAPGVISKTLLKYKLGLTKDSSGMPEGGVANTDISNVKKMMDAKSQQAINNAMYAMTEVAYLPKSQQAAAFQKISDDLVAAKKNIFDEAMMDYGIDLKYLDNELNTKGKAYTRIGFVVKEYKGRDDKGMPLFADYGVKEQEIEAKKILDLLGGLPHYIAKNKKEEQGE